MSDYEIRKSIVASVDIDGAGVAPLAIQLRYTRTDPFALWITCRAVDWCCARELLTTALAGTPSGEGDVYIRCDETYAYIELASPDGKAVVRISRDEADSFANATLELVPLGIETCYVDMEAVITGLLTTTDTR